MINKIYLNNYQKYFIKIKFIYLENIYLFKNENNNSISKEKKIKVIIKLI